ncbi:hypothetical protein NPIL_492311 [Nephila pilipes]|uniref:Uncharacterized protein n=1 Tax=Nephila pilipes TaxID=299642 RepID=A0A8X6N6Y7_NEPPI|nr:hypothetical protein NPIL_492311 [Nephila pilipes]
MHEEPEPIEQTCLCGLYSSRFEQISLFLAWMSTEEQRKTQGSRLGSRAADHCLHVFVNLAEWEFVGSMEAAGVEKIIP